MSEQAPNPSNNPEKERKPLTDNCDGCEKDYELTPDNTILVHYSTQDECDHLICQCTHCKYRTRIFIGEDTFEQAVNNGIPLQVEKNASQSIYEKWLDLNEVELVKTYELTNRHEAIVRRFGEALLSVPDEHLYDLITDTGYDQPYPQKWID